MENLLIKNSELDQYIKDRIAPIYFNCPQLKNQDMRNSGTVTLIDRQGLIYGVTNYHVFEHFEKYPTAKCQIGKNFSISFKKLVERIRKNSGKDLIVFPLYEDELAKIGKNKGFSNLDDNIKIHIGSQNEGDWLTWGARFAGYRGADRNSVLKGDHLEEHFGISSFAVYIRYNEGSDDKPERWIIGNYEKVKELSNEGKIKADFGEFPDENASFGGMSGGPVWGLTIADQTADGFSNVRLFGIIFEGNLRQIYAQDIYYVKCLLNESSSETVL